MTDDLALRRVAFECFSNAQSLHDEARLLAEHEYLARAAALAIIGLEEFAKSIAYTLAALIPQKHDLLTKRLDRHDIKHMIAIGAEAAEIETEGYRSVIADQSGFPVTAEERLDILFGWLVEHDMGSVAADSNGAKEFFKKFRTDYTPILPGPDLKNAALYVDVGPGGKALTPSRAEHLAETEILGLNWFLEVYRELPRVLEGDTVWCRFVEEVRKPQS